MDRDLIINFTYIICCVLFAFGLKFLGSPVTARKGNMLSMTGMLIAVVVTLISKEIVSYQWIALGVILGAAAGLFTATRAKMTQMPETIALLHGFGGFGSMLVDWHAYHMHPTSSLIVTIPTFLSVFVGGITFTGSCIAWGKLSERLPGKSIVFPGMQFINIGVLAAIAVLGLIFLGDPIHQYPVFLTIVILSLIMGVLLVIPIGGADMPVVISVLNSYAGLVACLTGFVIHNTVLIVVGALVGANGIILSIIMCKAMNRSLANVMFGGFAPPPKAKGTGEKKEAKSMSVEDAFLVLENAKSVVVVPGYGLAVAQAQHAVRELSELLEKNGAEVRFAIHPVAGRMPGHMNVLLAEASISYDQLYEMEAINPMMEMMDVAIVIGANDVVNPAARFDKSSPIYGMPIIDVDKAKTVFVLKRSMAAGFAGIENELFYNDNTRMIFGDAKQTLQSLVAEFKASAAV